MAAERLWAGDFRFQHLAHRITHLIRTRIFNALEKISGSILVVRAPTSGRCCTLSIAILRRT